MRSVRTTVCAVLVLGLAGLVSGPAFAKHDSGKHDCDKHDSGKHCDIEVEPGESIQAAVDAAAPGDTIRVRQGVYTEATGVAAVRITKPLKLIAQGAPGKVRILWNQDPAQRDGILVEPTDGVTPIDGLEITGFSVEGFPKNGIFLKHVNHFNIEGNQSINNLENGIWPTLSANGQVKKNVSYGSQDSALWIEASENVRVVDNELHHSPTGLEITISRDITVEGNDVHHNTVGMGLYHPAAAGIDSPWPYDELGNWQILKNDIHDNNEVNTAEGGETAALPPGIGILLLGVDRVNIEKNRIESNDYVGLGMIDWCLAVAGSGFDCNENTPDVQDPVPDYNQVTKNKFADNHIDSSPPPDVTPLQAADILLVGLDWFYSPGTFGTGTDNCFSKNKTYKTAGHPPLLTFPDPLPECD